MATAIFQNPDKGTRAPPPKHLVADRRSTPPPTHINPSLLSCLGQNQRALQHSLQPSHNPELDKLVGKLLTLPTADPAQTTMTSLFTGQPLVGIQATSCLARQPLEAKGAYSAKSRLVPVSTAVNSYCHVQAHTDCTSRLVKLMPSSYLVIPGSCQGHTWSYQAHTWSQIRSHFFSLSYCRSSRALSGGRFIEL